MPPPRRFMPPPEKPAERFAYLNYTLFAMKILMKAAPLLLPLEILGHFSYIVLTYFIQQVLFLKKLLELITQGGSFRDFILLLLIFCAGGLLAKFFDCFSDYISMVEGKTAYKWLNERIFQKASEADMECFDNPVFYDCYKRATEVITEGYYTNFAFHFAKLLANAATGVIMIVYVASVDAKALLVLIAGVAAFALKSVVNKLIFQKENAMVLNRRKKAYVQRVVFLRDYAKDVRTSGIYHVMHNRLVEATQDNRAIIKKYGKKIAALQMVASLFGEAVPIAGTFSYAAYSFVVKKSLDIANFSVLMTAISNIKTIINGIGEDFSSLQQLSLYFANFKRFLDYEPKMKSGGREAGELRTVAFRNVSFTYPGAKTPSLKNVSLTIRAGETIAVVGKNGAGKSTFVKLLLRFYDPDEGEVLYNGVNVREYDAESLRKRIGTVFQDYKVFALSVNENVLCRECGSDGERLRAETALKNSGAYEKIRGLPQGADTVLTREFDNEGIGLSGGEQQKIAAARMFAHAFDLAVLDEPSSALDPIAEYKMYENLIRETKNKTVLYISHRLSSAVLSDRIYVFSNGTVVERGTHEELMRLSGIYAEMFAMQASSYNDTQEETV